MISRVKKISNQIAKSIIELETSLEKDETLIIVSGMDSRFDNINIKGDEVNNRLVVICGDNVKINIDILIISEAKLDSSFPKFQLHGYSESYSFDRNGNDVGILLLNREDIRQNLKNFK